MPGGSSGTIARTIPGARAGRIVGLAGVSRDPRLTASVATPFTRFAPVFDHIREQFAEPVEVDFLARMAGMSPRTFQRRFKETFRLTPTEHVRQFRIAKACQMLIETDAAFAQATGFSDHSHLAREFTSTMSLAPGAYRKRYRRL